MIIKDQAHKIEEKEVENNRLNLYFEHQTTRLSVRLAAKTLNQLFLKRK